MWSTGREVTQDSGSAWVRREGMRLITEEENRVGRLQGQAESNWSTLPMAALILVTFLIAATKYRTRSNLKKEGFVLVYRASQLDPQAGRKGWPGHKTSRSSEPLSQARFYLQNIPQLSKIVSLTENQAFKHIACGEILHSSHNHCPFKYSQVLSCEPFFETSQGLSLV